MKVEKYDSLNLCYPIVTNYFESIGCREKETMGNRKGIRDDREGRVIWLKFLLRWNKETKKWNGFTAIQTKFTNFDNSKQ